MLVTLVAMKTYLGISTSDYDAFLTAQITLISDTIEAYCRRNFNEDSYVQTFYKDDYERCGHLTVYQYPVSVAAITEDGVTLDPSEYRFHKGTGIFTRPNSNFYNAIETVVTYTAGYSSIPTPVQSVVFDLVEERYNKKVSGTDLNFGSDVQRISIPGSISIDFDYSLSNNERSSAFGVILGSQVNILDYYRSDRAIVGSGKLNYVE